MFNFIQNQWLLVLTSFLLSLWLYYVYNVEDPYYNANMGKFYKVVSTYYLWANTMLLISLVFYNTSFSGGLVAWLTGIFNKINKRFAIYCEHYGYWEKEPNRNAY